MATSLELAITAIRSGRKEEGRQLLNLLIQQNPNNEMAWLWMSSVVANDEQRARCLYHVLAIDPDNAVARQGLKVLGIVVSDSRPVKVPRDSQPIKIPKPRPKSQTGPLTALPEPQSTPSSGDERRPFRLDPQAVVDELPFTPVKAPFTQTVQPVSTNPPSAQTPSEPVPITAISTNPSKAPQSVSGVKINFTPKIAPRQTPQAGRLQASPEPGSVAAANAAPTPQPQPNPQNQGQTQPLPDPSKPVPITQPGPTAASQAQTPITSTSPAAQSQSQPASSGGSPHWPTQSSLPDTGPLEGAPPPGQQFDNSGMPIHETRPTQPMPTPYPNPAMGMQPYALNNSQQPYGAAAFHSNMTMGMPMQPPAPYPSHIHSQATMGVPINNYAPYQPVPVAHSNTTMAMPFPTYLPGQQLPQNAAVHSNSTMAMLPGQPGLVDYQQAVRNPAHASPAEGKRNKPVAEEEEEGINVLAVIIFGSLSVTALGGLGMLILLMFAAN